MDKQGLPVHPKSLNLTRIGNRGVDETHALVSTILFLRVIVSVQKSSSPRHPLTRGEETFPPLDVRGCCISYPGAEQPSEIQSPEVSEARDKWGQHHTKANVVDPVGRTEPAAAGTTHVPVIIVERPATNNTDLFY